MYMEINQRVSEGLACVATLLVFTTPCQSKFVESDAGEVVSRKKTERLQGFVPQHLRQVGLVAYQYFL